MTANSALEQAASAARPWQRAQRRQCVLSGPRPVLSPPLLTASVGCTGAAMTAGTRAHVRPRPPRWREAAGGLTLAAMLGISPLGCCTIAGYGIGAAADSNRFVDVPLPYAKNVPPLAGKVVRITTVEQHVITGRLTGVDPRPDGGAVCFIEPEVSTAWIGGHQTRVDSVSLESFVSAQVSPGAHAYRDAGVLVGVAADAVWLISILLEDAYRTPEKTQRRAGGIGHPRPRPSGC
jgi:hypothetical protein